MEIVNEHSFRVFFIDHGITKTIDLSSLFSCRGGTKRAGLAIKCSMRSILPAGTTDGSWTKNSIEAVQRVIGENKVFVDDVDLKSMEKEPEMMFTEIYYVEPEAQKALGTLKTRKDYVPMSYFLKSNGLALTNRNEVAARCNDSRKSDKTLPQNLVEQKGQTCSEESGIVLQVTEMSDGESEDEGTTVLFMPKVESKPAPVVAAAGDPQYEGPTEDSMSLTIDEVFNSVFDATPSGSSAVAHNCNGRSSLSQKPALILDCNFSPDVSDDSPISDENVALDSPIIEGVKLWDETSSIARFYQNATFDMTKHGIADFLRFDEAGDEYSDISILKDSFYKPLKVPPGRMTKFQFERVLSDGVSFKGVCKELNESLISEMNAKIDEMIKKNNYHGRWFGQDDKLYPEMAACAMYHEDHKWYRCQFLERHENDLKCFKVTN